MFVVVGIETRPQKHEHSPAKKNHTTERERERERERLWDIQTEDLDREMRESGQKKM
jgi:hypothetical protein